MVCGHPSRGKNSSLYLYIVCVVVCGWPNAAQSNSSAWMVYPDCWLCGKQVKGEVRKVIVSGDPPPTDVDLVKYGATHNPPVEAAKKRESTCMHYAKCYPTLLQVRQRRGGSPPLCARWPSTPTPPSRCGWRRPRRTGRPAPSDF